MTLMSRRSELKATQNMACYTVSDYVERVNARLDFYKQIPYDLT